MFRGQEPDSDLDLNGQEMDELQTDVFNHYRRQGYSNLEAYDLATEQIKREMGCGPSRKRERRDREVAHLADLADQISARSGRSGRPVRGSSRRHEEFEEYEREAPRRHSQQPSSRSTQSTSQTEYDRMFQNGSDKYASRTSGKILSPEEVDALAERIYNDLIQEGKNQEYARQKTEQFAAREHGKRATKMREAGYRFKGDSEDEEDDANARCNARRSQRRDTDRAGPTRGGYDNRNDYDAGHDRSGYGSRHADPEEAYDTSYPYSDADLKLMRKKIFEDWCAKGVNPREAQREANKWYDSKMKGRNGGSSSRRFGFDSYNDVHDTQDDEDDYPRTEPRPSRGARSGKSGKSRQPGRNGPEFDDYYTEEPKDDFRSRKTGNSRGCGGYRTEERRPGGDYSSNNYSDYGEPGGVKPAMDLYKLLGVSKTETVDAIKKAHKKLCMKYHPDRVSGGAAAKKAATDKMAQINQACDVLKDHDMRAYYDRTGLIASMCESPDA